MEDNADLRWEKETEGESEEGEGITEGDPTVSGRGAMRMIHIV